MLEAAGAYDPSADTAGVTLTIVMCVILWGILTVKNRMDRG